MINKFLFFKNMANPSTPTNLDATLPGDHTVDGNAEAVADNFEKIVSSPDSQEIANAMMTEIRGKLKGWDQKRIDAEREAMNIVADQLMTEYGVTRVEALSIIDGAKNDLGLTQQ